MDKLIGVSRKQIPADFVPLRIFPKKSNLIIASVLFSFPILITVLFLWNFFTNAASHGLELKADEAIPFFVILLPLLLFTVPYFIEQRFIRKHLVAGKPMIGAFFGEDALLWCTKRTACHYIPKSSVRTFELRGRVNASQPGGRGICHPDWMEISGDDYRVRIPGAIDYQVLEIIRYLETWNPEIVMRIDPNFRE